MRICLFPLAAISFCLLTSCGGFQPFTNTTPAVSLPAENVQNCSQASALTSLCSGFLCTSKKLIHSGDNVCATDDQGLLRCWGKNLGGAVGDGTQTVRTTPIAVNAPSKYAVVAMNMDQQMSCAVTRDCNLQCWGSPQYYQLGNGSSAASLVPIPVDSLNHYTSVAVGYSSACGIDTTGTLRCWGQNSQGALGLPSTVSLSSTPVVIDAGVTYLSISGGRGSHLCGITSSHELKCWGANSSGEIGDGTTTTVFTPKVIDSGTTYASVSVGTLDTCAITTAHVLKCWGYNGSSALGDGTTTGRLSPVVIDSGVGYQQVSTHFLSTCGLTVSGTVKCWGSGTSYATGTGSATTASTPVAISSDVYTSISLGSEGGCGILSTGTAKCWGLSHYGQMGDGSIYIDVLPTVVASAGAVTSASTGAGNLSCAVSTTGSLNCIGVNAYLGNGTQDTTASWLAIDSPTLYSSVATGSSDCAITTAGVLKCWGDNSSGGVGNNSHTTALSPVVIDAGTSYSSVSTFVSHVCAITTAGVLKCWGSNAFGQVGDGTTVDKLVPTIIDSGTTYVQVSAGANRTCGRTSANVLKCWGMNSLGNPIGDGSNADLHSPTIIDPGVSYLSVSAGVKVCGVASDRTLRCTATLFDNSTSYASVTTGVYSSCAITTSGQLRCWRDQNLYENSAVGTYAAVASPVAVSNMTFTSATATSLSSGCAIGTDSQLYCWGNRNFFGGVLNFSFPTPTAATGIF